VPAGTDLRHNRRMEDLGPPVAYMALREGTAVYSRDGQEVGTVAHVLADVEADVFDGLVLETSGGHRFADAPEVGELHERGVLLKLSAEEAAQLPEPGKNPATLDLNPADAEESELSAKLRRAWDYISGRY
jgi:hypothetical protein